MVIYVDVLFVVNLAVNYFILLFTAKAAKEALSLRRLLAGASLGALFSLYILMPPLHAVLEIAIKFLFGAAIIFAAFGRRKPRAFLRLLAYFLSATFVFGGAMLAIYTIFKPRGMAIDGGVVYFDISPLLLIASTALCYGIIRLLQHASRKKNPTARRAEIKIAYGQREADGRALVDTGHSLSDPFSGAEVVLISPKLAKALLPNGLEGAKQGGRYRLIPCRTAGGQGILEGFRPDRVAADGLLRENAVVAISENICGDDYEAIIKP